MVLLAGIEAVCRRLAPAGWQELLRAHGLDLGAADLAAELRRELDGIDRTRPGFEDFAPGGRRAIEPGRPAESLLYHALASPGVVDPSLADYPTLAELEAVEDYVFGVDPPTLDDLRDRFPGAPLALVVMAYEYRPAVDTVHREHADLCLSRTGVARVGTDAPRYGGRERGFLASPTDGGGIHVLPARYAPWIAVRLTGDATTFGPMNFDLRLAFPGLFDRLRPDGVEPPDGELAFWVPLHKVFGGGECLRGLDLDVALDTGHANEKLRRLHRKLGAASPPAGDLDAPPYVLRALIAELSPDPDHGSGVVAPVPHDRLIEPAELGGEPVEFAVPPGLVAESLGPSLSLGSEGAFRDAPEYAHARHLLRPDGDLETLNDDPDVLERVAAGGYDALLYVDFTGDGWVQASCLQLEVELPSIPAYSLVTAPDFYPDVDQREISEWWLGGPALPFDAWRAPPLTLSDVRLMPNLQHPDGRLVAGDGVASAIVSLPATHRLASTPGPPAELKRTALGRHPHLPDAAASVFAPGWDVSVDLFDGDPHMAAYGLGSPFPEDAKLCAALSTFWPAVAPDAARTFSLLRPTVAPLSDQEIGSFGAEPWDGVPGPHAIGGTSAELASWNHADYVEEALAGRFTLAHTARVSTAEYVARILAMALAYAALAADGEARPKSWRVLGFRPLADGDPDLADAQAATGEVLAGDRFAVGLALPAGDPQPKPGDHRTTVVALRESVDVLVGAGDVALLRRGGAWRASVPVT